MPHVLVIAIGNPLRSDDGLAWRAADELAKEDVGSEVKIVKVHQLTPEHAESASQTDLMIFIDAAGSGDPGTVHSLELTGRDEVASFSHSLTPQSLLTLAKKLYEKAPKAFLVSMPGKSFDHGESLSTEVQESLPSLVELVCELINNIASG